MGAVGRAKHDPERDESAVQHVPEHEEREGGYYRLELAWGPFARSLTLPEGVSAEGIKANFERGVLEVRVPEPEQSKPQRVAITLGGGEQKATEEGSPSDQ